MTRVPYSIPPGVQFCPPGFDIYPNHVNQRTEPVHARPPNTGIGFPSIPPGADQLPHGLPPELWIEFARIQADKEVQLKTIQLKEKEYEHNMAMFAQKAPLNNHNTQAPQIRFRRLRDNENIDTYLRAFEHLAQSNKWPKDTWSAHLAPELTGKAFEAYANLPLDQANNYEVLKKVILTKYEINAESFRIKFRNRERKDDETITEWVHDLKQNVTQWVSFADIPLYELIIMEQAMKCMPRDLATHLRDHKPSCCNEMAKLADEFVANRGGSQYWSRKQQFQTKKNHTSADKKKTYSNKYDRSNNTGNKDSHSNSGEVKNDNQITGESNPSTDRNTQNRPNNTEIRCFKCQEIGHKANRCPSKSSGENKMQTGSNPKKAYKCINQTHQADFPASENEIEERRKKCEIVGTVNGRPVTIHRDSMCTQTVVAADLVPEQSYTGKYVTVRGITGSVSLPLANIDLQCKLVSGHVQVAVVPGLHREVLLGHDLDETCGEMLTREICVLTRQQSKQKINEQQSAEAQLLMDRPTTLNVLVDIDNEVQNETKLQNKEQNRPNDNVTQSEAPTRSNDIVTQTEAPTTILEKSSWNT
jgi:hypothetical protein